MGWTDSLAGSAMAAALVFAVAAAVQAGEALPVGGAPKALEFPHFPDRLHAFVWRNWSLVAPGRLAKVLGTTEANVVAIGESMGLPAARPIPPALQARGYITVLRRNWHLLPYDQLLVLLDLSAEQLAYCLREDDFLFHKLGALKPRCEPLRYQAPSETARTRAAEIRRVVEETFGEALHKAPEPRFAFVEALSKPSGQAPPAREKGGRTGSPRFIYSYFGLYGDPLMHPEESPYPDGLLERLAGLGVNGVWMHVVLRTLAPSRTFPEYGAGHETRLATLRSLVERARRYGIDIYLYMNEPRAMPEAFFRERPAMRGVREGDHFALCTSSPEVCAWLTDSLAHVFRSVPGLGGVFTITGSENLTNCASHRGWQRCPQCKARSAAEIIAEVNGAIEAGVHRGNPDARVIVWDWGWDDAWTPDIIAKLPKSAWLMSVSEWSKPITRGGVSTAVGEYSISAVGPGPRATKHWALAREAGLKTVAKCQFNNTWELSAVPYLPVLDLTAEHCSNLAEAGVDGLMLSWSLGGYPSPNLEVAARFGQSPPPSREAALDAVAARRFGPAGAPHARVAWSAFSRAFREFPFHIRVLYTAPQQYGPANLLYATPTGYKATMVGIPYDDVDTWRGPYPGDVFAGQFSKVADGWALGIEALRRAVENAPPARQADARAELCFAEAAGLHFRSVANQVRFTLARNTARAGEGPGPAERETMARAARDELEAARRLFPLAMADSRIGYEASNHYYYVPLDLVEKVINCRYILDHVPARDE